MRVPSAAASASFTRPACAIETRCESTAQTAASNGVPNSTGRRPPASSSSRAITGSRAPTPASSRASTSSDSTRAACASTRAGGRSETKSTSTDGAVEHRAERDRISPVVGQREDERRLQGERPARLQRDRHFSA